MFSPGVTVNFADDENFGPSNRVFVRRSPDEIRSLGKLSLSRFLLRAQKISEKNRRKEIEFGHACQSSRLIPYDLHSVSYDSLNVVLGIYSNQ